MFQWSVVKLYLSVREGIKEASEADRMSFPVWRAVAAVLYDGLLLELRYADTDGTGFSPCDWEEAEILIKCCLIGHMAGVERTFLH